MPFELVGIIACATLIGVPLGVPLMIIGGLPFALVDRRRLLNKVEKHHMAERKRQAYQEYNIEGEVIKPPWM